MSCSPRVPRKDPPATLPRVGVLPQVDDRLPAAHQVHFEALLRPGKELLILTAFKKLAERERTLQIRGCSETLFKTFQMIKFDTLISIKR